MKNEHSSKILVTGACGFLGSRLVRRLRLDNPDAWILGVDNLWTGVRRQDDWRAMDHVHEGDVEQYPFAHKFDRVYHFASPASPPKYQSDPLRTIRANVMGLMRCLDLVAPDGRIMFASSSEVYGDPVVSPQPEDYKGQVNFTGPRACYDESKRLCETILNDAHRTRGISFVAPRFFNVYGPGTLPDDGRAVSNFITRALAGLPIQVYGDGLQTRCFTYVDDVMDAVTLLMHNRDLVGAYNVGTTIETSLLDIAYEVRDQVEQRVDSWVGIVHNPPVVDDPRQRLPDMTRTEAAIGWQASTSYQLGIGLTIEYFNKLGVGTAT